MSAMCKRLLKVIIWFFSIVGLVILAADLGCLLYVRLKAPSGSLFDKALSSSEQEAVRTSLLACLAILGGGFVALALGRLCKRVSNAAIALWFTFAVLCGEKHASVAVSAMYFLQVQLPLAWMGALPPRAFAWSEKYLPEAVQWWWMAQVAYFCFVCWLQKFHTGGASPAQQGQPKDRRRQSFCDEV